MAAKRPIRFYDNRQKYLAFVNTCNEKRKVGERASRELPLLEPQPPALRVFDAGMGDGTILAHVMRSMHFHFPTHPFYVVGKEISLEDIRLSLEILPDRFVEHPATVVVYTNMLYKEAPWLTPSKMALEDINWRVVELEGNSASEYDQQLGSLDEFLVDGWQIKSSEKTGNPLYVRPSVLVVYRKDHKFLLDSVVPKQDTPRADFDLVIASQPWRARMSAEFKVKYVLSPLTRALRSGGRLIAVQSCGLDPGLEIIREIWPEEDPFQVNRHELMRELRRMLDEQSNDYTIDASAEEHGLFQYQMHTLPEEIGESIGTSTLFAAWNAAVYVAQIDDQRLEEALQSGNYLEATARVLHKHNGLWFNDESFVITRR
ncbi:MAG: hypothetical protein AAF465_05205 [Pseudomonadota bacterium]